MDCPKTRRTVGRWSLTDFREGAIGRITLETPRQWEEWLKAARKKEAELKAAREAKKAARSGQENREE